MWRKGGPVSVCVLAEKPTVDHFGFVQYTEHELVAYFWWFHIAGLVWVSQFLITCQQFVISSTVAEWYFTRWV